jgi:hypothetical protein
MGGGTALNILSPAIATNESCSPDMYLDNTLGVYHCHDGTHEISNVNMTNQWQRAW